MSQPTPSLATKRNSLRAPSRARLTKQPSALSLRSPPPSNRLSTTPTSSKFSTQARTTKNNNSKRLSTHSLRSLVRKKSTHSLAAKSIRDISPSPSISAPAPPRELLRLSEILDPEELIREHRSLSGTPAPGTPVSPNNPDGEFPGLQATESGGEARRLIIHSPSGARLDAEAFAQRKDRPLTLGERQQRIRDEMERQADDERREGLERAMRKQGKRACCRVM
ncbi:MAG: hypothetical protein L6R38_000218 [Xanthoria sp. 2 TBL-2021]|nr:MAG: hypothetical protein L6R38_000218 [Xanthoria sp. 2 TBL-2021]